jgi:hypothetical protein
VNGDHALDVSDAIFTLQYLFLGGPEPVPIAHADECSLTAEDCNSLAGMLPDLEFGRFVAGSWLTNWAGSNKSLATLSADGTITISSNETVSLGHGTWRRTGPRQTTSVVLFFDYDDAGVPREMLVERIVSTLSVDGNTRSGTIRFEFYPWPHNPFENPEVQPNDVADRTFTSVRIR